MDFESALTLSDLDLQSLLQDKPIVTVSTKHEILDIALTSLDGVCNNLSQNSSTLRLLTTQGQWVTNNVTHSYLDPIKSPNIWTVLDLFGTTNEPDLIVIDHGYNDYNLDQTDSDALL